MTTKLLMFLLTATALASATACRTENAAAAAAKAPPPAVAFVSVSPEPVAITSEWIATLDGTVNAQIRPQVSGYLVQRTYREGAFVRKGDVLFDIDRRPFETALNQATGRLAESQAQLTKAERDLARDKPLAEQRAIAQSQLDNDVSARDAAQASVSSSKAAVEAARLNLGFTRVTSLIDGVAAIAAAQIGDLVGPSTLLTTVSQVDPIKVYFPISEREYLAIAPSLARQRRRQSCGRRAAVSRSCWLTAPPTNITGRCSPWIARSIRRWAPSGSARRFQIPATFSARVSTAAFARKPPFARTRCWFRSEPSQSSRTDFNCGC
jgi:multidrug efflux pump subunit AcrA (membrane-fusion protein)